MQVLDRYPRTHVAIQALLIPMKRGIEPHDLKPKKHEARYDLFLDKDGYIYVKPIDNSGLGDPTGYNING